MLLRAHPLQVVRPIRAFPLEERLAGWLDDRYQMGFEVTSDQLASGGFHRQLFGTSLRGGWLRLCGWWGRQLSAPAPVPKGKDRFGHLNSGRCLVPFQGSGLGPRVRSIVVFITVVVKLAQRWAGS